MAYIRPVILVLGDVSVSGAQWRLTPQQLSLIAFLASQGECGRDSLVGALWDGYAVSAGRLANLLSETRSVIGRRHLPESASGRYRLAGVTTDLALFGMNVAKADDGGVAETIAHLRRALELVRGVPYTNPGGRYWAWPSAAPGLVSSVEMLISETATRLADVAVDVNDFATARWACEHALQAVPLDEGLTTRLVGVYLALGKPGIARRLVQDWEAAVSRLGCGPPSTTVRRRLASGAGATT